LAIDSVTEDSHIAQVDRTIALASQEQIVSTVEIGMVAQAERQQAGAQAEEHKAATADSGASSGSSILPSSPSPAEGSAEGRVYGEMLWEKSGIHAAAKIVKTGIDIVQDRGTGFDAGRIEKLSGGTINANNVRSIDHYAKEMSGMGLGNAKRDSFKAAGDNGAGVAERARIQGEFTSKSKVSGMAVKPDAINVQLVKTLVQSKKLASEQELAQGLKVKPQVEANMAQARAMGMNPTGPKSPSLTHDLASGPKFKAPVEEGTRDTSSSWA